MSKNLPLIETYTKWCDIPRIYAVIYAMTIRNDIRNDDIKYNLEIYVVMILGMGIGHVESQSIRLVKLPIIAFTFELPRFETLEFLTFNTLEQDSLS